MSNFEFPVIKGPKGVGCLLLLAAFWFFVEVFFITLLSVIIFRCF